VIEVAAGPTTVAEFGALSQSSGATVTWTAILSGRKVFGRTSGELVDDCAAASGEVWPQVTCLPVRILFTLADPPSALSKFPVFAEILAAPLEQRAALYQRDEWVERASAELAKEWDPLWSRTRLIEEAGGAETVGPSVAALAARAGTSPMRALVDTSCERGLNARFDVVVGNDDAGELGDLLADPRTLLGLSDAGAHASQLCDAGYATHLLGHWWRETGTLSLERAVWRLTGHPASVFGIEGRGELREGAFADLVVFDPTRVVDRATYQKPRELAEGMDWVIVNGAIARKDAAFTGARAGKVLKKSQ